MCFRPIGKIFHNLKNLSDLLIKIIHTQLPALTKYYSRKIVCPGFAYKITAGARSDTHGLVRDFSGDHTKVFKVRLRRDKNFNLRRKAARPLRGGPGGGGRFCAECGAGGGRQCLQGGMPELRGGAPNSGVESNSSARQALSRRRRTLKTLVWSPEKSLTSPWVSDLALAVILKSYVRTFDLFDTFAGSES